MMESFLINEVLETLDSYGVGMAYRKLLSGYKELDNPSAQIYLFLSSLAALNGYKEEALEWLKVSIEDKGYWYKSGTLYDKDLDTIRDDSRFKKLLDLSETRYKSAFTNGEIECSWEIKTHDNIALVLHGNQQNNEVSNKYWKDVCFKNTQLEFLQSPDIDSFDLCWWMYEKDYTELILSLLNDISWFNYKTKTLCGFSSGCNVILQLIEKSTTICDRIILVAPWIPILDSKPNILVNNVIKSSIEVYIICGEKDPNKERIMSLEKILKEKNAKAKVKYIEGLYHSYPNNLGVLIDDM